ncbi:MAG: undecaprenyl-diphosphate phosphatase [Clostridiales bacterium]|jgi:undecaprenyl-diphosphatase|nr:undecaprenyl-diphosphate phosphatase [Clostridiales bacterium]
MSIIEAIFLGLLQGLTEFFPVSSSGHLVLFQDILGIESSMTFDIMLHVGTLISIFAVFWREILGLFKPPFNRLIMLAVASVPAAVLGFFVNDWVEGFFGEGTYLPFFFLATAAVLLAADVVGRIRKKPGTPVGIVRAVIIGVAQAAAIFPGLSRSGMTISAGIVSGAERDKAARFSFLLSVPIIAGSALFSVLKGGLSDGNVGMSAMAVGILMAAASGFLALKLMLKAVSKNNYRWFALYMLALSAVTFVNYYIVSVF